MSDTEMGIERKLFGTDGIRGRANRYPLTPEVALRVGRAVGSAFKSDGSGDLVVIGHDTRLSSDMLVTAIISGICSSCINVLHAGIVPTPAVAYLVREVNACAGVAITASHNPYHDNGIKIFNSEGFKLSDETERQLEALILGDHLDGPPVDQVGRLLPFNQAVVMRYIDFLSGSVDGRLDLKSLNLVVDCANGAAYAVAPQLFKRLGINATFMGTSPDGRNINDGCGSEATEALVGKVLAHKADLGIALDGDGDRLIVIDDSGERLSGDVLIALLADQMQRKNALNPALVVTTEMSNIGLKSALSGMRIDHIVTAVGDRYVTQKMVATGAVLGGEDSGHIVFLKDHTAGDGLFTALRILEIVVEQKKPLSSLKRIMTPQPQVLLNVAVKSKPPLKSIPEIAAAIDTVQQRLSAEGRVLVRYSGTQPLCRVMVEAPLEADAKGCCQAIAQAVAAVLG